MPIASPRNRGLWNASTEQLPFFQAMASVLIANVLTVTFVYCFAKIHQKECIGEEEGRLAHLWLIILVFLFMLYGLYTWGV
jgi:high-affinity Fe2+/Pb2+ permease